MNVQKEARRDAAEFARAQMAYGEGAGTRRRLIKATVDHKADTIPGYLAAFYEAAVNQDMAKHASAAKRERRIKDTSAVVNKNVKAAARGDWRSASTPIILLVITGYILHQTEMDKKIYAKGKEIYNKIKNRQKDKDTVQSILNEHK